MAVRSQPRSFSIAVEVDDPVAAEWASAEAWEAGAIGVEERELSAGLTGLVLYAEMDRVAAVTAAVATVPGTRVGATEEIVAKDWSQAWREGLTAIAVGERLVVRPSWIDVVLEPGQVEVVIDPGQAFGTGAHVSTRLLLDWIEELAGEGAFDAQTRFVDVGVGTGVLALAALKLGAGRGVGFDLDPLAGAATREWAERNGLAERLHAFVGPVEAIGPTPRFDWVFANLLKREMLPIAEELARITVPGGRAIFSGLLAREQDEVETALARAGFGASQPRTAVDLNNDAWVSLVMTRGA